MNVLVMDKQDTAAEYGEAIQEEISAKILHILSVYPALSKTMLQVGIGTGISPAIWHPVLDRLIELGQVDIRQIMSHTAKGREQTYTIISLRAA